MVTEMVDDLENEAISHREQAGKHPLELVAESRAADDAGNPEAQADASWENLPVDQLTTAKSNVNVYLGGFISVIQGGSRERHQMRRHLFHQINRVFRPNKEAETKRKYPISLKNLG